MSNDAPKKRLTGIERRELIIKNTIDLVSEKGFKSVTTKDIAQRSQINEALIFQHFKTKQELMNAAVGDILNRRTAFIGEMRTPLTEQEFIEKLNLYEEYFLSHNFENPAYLKIVLYYILEGYSYSHDVGMPFNEIFQKWLYDAIEKGKREWNYSKYIDSDIAISAFIGGFIYYILRNVIMDNKTQKSIEYTEHKFVKTFINSLYNNNQVK